MATPQACRLPNHRGAAAPDDDGATCAGHGHGECGHSRDWHVSAPDATHPGSRPEDGLCHRAQPNVIPKPPIPAGATGPVASSTVYAGAPQQVQVPQPQVTVPQTGPCP